MYFYLISVPQKKLKIKYIFIQQCKHAVINKFRVSNHNNNNMDLAGYGCLLRLRELKCWMRC